MIDRLVRKSLSRRGDMRLGRPSLPRQHPVFDGLEKSEKRCRTCREVKPLTPEFWARDRNSSDGFQGWCKACKQAKQRADYTTLGGREQWLKRQYGLTHAEYLELLASVDNKCQVCGAGEGASKRNGKWTHLSIDHVHETGEIRGILCDRCNPGVGMFRDDPELLEKAAAYLRAAGSKPIQINDESINTWKGPWTNRNGKEVTRWFSDTPEVAHKVYRSKRAALADATLAIRKRRSEHVP